MAEVVLATERLVIREWRDSDLSLWLQHLNTPEVKEHLGGVQAPELVAEKFAKTRQAWVDDRFSFLAVDAGESGEFVGTVGLGRIANEGTPAALTGEVQIGWQLRVAAWGQGYATEAAAAMMEWGFAEHKLPAIYAQTSLRNAASWRVMEKLAMKRTPWLDYTAPDYPPEDNPTIIYAAFADERGETR